MRVERDRVRLSMASFLTEFVDRTRRIVDRTHVAPREGCVYEAGRIAVFSSRHAIAPPSISMASGD